MIPLWNTNLVEERPTFVTHLECSLTGERYEADQLHDLSEAGRPLLVRYDLDAARAFLPRAMVEARPTDLWRWRELLPVRRTENIVSLGEIETPLDPAAHIAAAPARRRCWSRTRAGCRPDRSRRAGWSMAVAMAKELGVTRIAMPTNGNAGAALAAYASRAGIETIVLCPDDTPEINVREIALQGARVYRVNGLIDECGAIVGKGAAEGRWFDFSTLKEPYRIEGKKTMGLELAAQLGWRLPDAIFYPTGGGTGLIGMWKAFDEMEALGWIGPERPRMFAVQASKAARRSSARSRRARSMPSAGRTRIPIAAGIRVPKAVGDFLILRAVRESGGRALAVGDPAILKAVEDAAKRGRAAAVPGRRRDARGVSPGAADGLVDEDDEVVLFNCATGLKYPMPDRSRFLDRHGEIDHAVL